MTSEYEKGLDLFELTPEQGSEAQKTSKRVVRRRTGDATAQVVVKVKPAYHSTKHP